MHPPVPPGALRLFIAEILDAVAPEIAADFGHTGPLAFKHGHEAITEVDRRVEDRLRAAILARFPDHRVEGEEAGAQGPGDSEWTWHIDPIDGTLNYSVGIPLFSSTVAVEHQGVLLAGGVVDPLRAELFTAARHEGAWRGEIPLRVSARPRLGEALVSTQFGRRSIYVDDPALLQTLLRAPLKTRRLGTIALELAYVAAGRMDMVLAGKGVPQNLYDVAAGVLLVEEAGGRVTDAEGGPFGPGSRELVASNGRIHQEILDLLDAHRGRRA
jgi:myo-inositol-1(or 4)-monophosphatase